MAASNVKEYVLPSDGVESKRLNLQHEAFVSSAGYLLHPRIASSLESSGNIHIAEVATGTGAWLLDLQAERAASSPSWTFTGLDINPAQFPKSSTCNFDAIDIRQPVPSHLRETFDVVHIRLILGGLTTPDWTTVANNVFDLLKPGGWIQWHEVDVTSIRPYPKSAGPAKVDASQKLLHEFTTGFAKIGKFMAEDMPLFGERIAGAGFSDVEVHMPSSDRVVEMRDQSSITMCEAASEAFKFLVRNEPDSEISSDDAEKMAEDAKAELRNGGVYWRWDGYVVTGRKGEL